jgi:hypothetical protein
MTTKDFCRKGSNSKVSFYCFENGNLFYIATAIDTGLNYLIKVPVEDCGDGIFLAEDRVNIFMRYIRKSIDNGTIQPLNEVIDFSDKVKFSHFSKGKLYYTFEKEGKNAGTVNDQLR